MLRQHHPESEAHPYGEMRLNEYEPNEKNEPKDEHQTGVVENVVGDEQEEKPGHGSNQATEHTQQPERLRSNPEPIDSGSDAQGSQGHHYERKALLALEPLTSIFDPLLQEIPPRRPLAASIDLEPQRRKRR